MSKYDKMIELNRERSDEKIMAAKMAIRKLIENGDPICIPQLMRMTGLSRGFFYKNAIVRAEVEQAVQQQAGKLNPRKHILNKAMDDRIGLLQEQLAITKRENEMLKAENLKLKKALEKKSRSIISSL